MPSPALLAWSNTFKTGTVSANSAAPSLGASNLSNDQGNPSNAWQTAAGVTTLAAGALVKCVFPVAGSTIKVVGLFRTNLTPSATVNFTLWSGASAVWTVNKSGPAVDFGQVLAVLPDGMTGDFMQIYINDSTNPDGFLNIPLAFCGPAWNPSVGLSFASAFGMDDSADEIVSRGGQEFVTNRWTRRRFEMKLEGIKTAEIWTKQAALDRASRFGGNVLLVPDYNSSTMAQEAIYGRLKATADVTYPAQSGDARAWSATITERL